MRFKLGNNCSDDRILEVQQVTDRNLRDLADQKVLAILQRGFFSQAQAAIFADKLDEVRGEIGAPPEAVATISRALWERQLDAATKFRLGANYTLPSDRVFSMLQQAWNRPVRRVRTLGWWEMPFRLAKEGERVDVHRDDLPAEAIPKKAVKGSTVITWNVILANPYFGGELRVYPPFEGHFTMMPRPAIVKAEVGDLVLINGSLRHEVEEIIQGSRCIARGFAWFKAGAEMVLPYRI